MRIIIIFTGFIVSLMLIYCNDDIRLPQSLMPQLVVWGALHPDSIPKVYVSRSFDPLSPEDTRSAIIEGALVLLYENDRLMDTLDVQSAGRYAADRVLPLRAGAAYRVKVIKSGFPPLFTRPDTMPVRPTVASISAKLQPQPSGNFIAVVTTTLTKPVTNTYLGRNMYQQGAYDEVLPEWLEPGEGPCGYGVFPSLYNYIFVDYACQKDYNQIILRNPSLSSEDARNRFDLRLAFFSEASLRLFEKIGLFKEQNIRSNFTVNPFFDAISLPIEAEGGFGVVSCYTSLSIPIKF